MRKTKIERKSDIRRKINRVKWNKNKCQWCEMLKYGYFSGVSCCLLFAYFILIFFCFLFGLDSISSKKNLLFDLLFSFLFCLLFVWLTSRLQFILTNVFSIYTLHLLYTLCYKFCTLFFSLYHVKRRKRINRKSWRFLSSFEPRSNACSMACTLYIV